MMVRRKTKTLLVLIDEELEDLEHRIAGIAI